MAEPRFQHTQEELAFVVELLAFLNRDDDEKGHACGLEGKLTLYWSDCVMGTVAKIDTGDPRSWCYFPTAQGDAPERTAPTAPGARP